MSEICDSLVLAYRTTRFRVRSDNGEFDLIHGQASSALLALHAAYDVTSSAYITAWNPGSRPQSNDENRAAQERLIADIENAGLRILHGKGIGTDPEWRPEESVLVLGIDRDAASRVGRKYGQNAIVFSDANAVPQLIMLGAQQDSNSS